MADWTAPRDLALGQARALIQRAVDKAEQLGVRGAIAVVGASGALVSASRMDAGGPGGMARARSKAWISATQQIPTAEHHHRMTTLAPPIAAGFVQASPEAVFPGAGGLPIRADGVVVAGIAASGATVSPFFPDGVEPASLSVNGPPANPEDLLIAYALQLPYTGQHGDDRPRWAARFGDLSIDPADSAGMSPAPAARRQAELSWAKGLCDRVLREAERRDLRVAVAVVDRGGDAIQQDLMDGAGRRGGRGPGGREHRGAVRRAQRGGGPALRRSRAAGPDRDPGGARRGRRRAGPGGGPAGRRARRGRSRASQLRRAGHRGAGHALTTTMAVCATRVGTAMSPASGGVRLMRFRILGSLEAEAAGGLLPAGPPGQQRVLAVLLLNANQAVPVTRLVDALWDAGPPATAAKQARNTVSRLRKLLTPGGPAVRIATAGAGYRLSVPAAALDASLFEAQVRAADAAMAGQRDHEALLLLREALALWRGPALDGLTGQVIEAAAAGWNERRCAVMEKYYDRMLGLGQHRGAVVDLTGQVAEHPLREKPAEKLMLALYRCGRRADALSVYARTRAQLAEELGLDPGPGLQRLHHQILSDDPALAPAPVPAGPAGNGHGAPVTPAPQPAAPAFAAPARAAPPTWSR